MTGKVLAIGGAALAAVAIVLWVWLRQGDGAAPVSPSLTIGSSALDPAATPPSLPGDRPGAPGSGTAAAGTTDYTADNVHVRDHRTGDTSATPIVPNVHRPGARELPSSLTHDISQKLKAVVYECMTELPRDARGPKPRIEGGIDVAIKDHQLAITAATIQLRDATGDAADAARQCVEHKAIGLATAASDQDDLDSYTIGVTFAIP